MPIATWMCSSSRTLLSHLFAAWSAWLSCARLECMRIFWYIHLRSSKRWWMTAILSSSKHSKRARSSMRPSRETALRWLRQADHDLTVARGHQERADYSDACFMAEQAAQKALKAFLIGHGHRSVPIHSVAQLAERCT